MQTGLYPTSELPIDLQNDLLFSWPLPKFFLKLTTVAYTEARQKHSSLIPETPTSISVWYFNVKEPSVDNDEKYNLVSVTAEM
jgi:hypothetical protein